MTFDEFLSHVLPSVAGCPDSVALDHIIKAARNFCARTLVWNEESEFPALTIIGESVYPLDMDEDQERVKLLAAWIDNVPVRVLDIATGISESKRTGGAFMYLANSLDLTIRPVPSIAGQAIVTHLALKPSLLAVNWPDELAEHVTDIAHGAIASLCRLPRQQWTDRATALDEEIQFNQRIGVVGFNVAAGFSASLPRPRVNFF